MSSHNSAIITNLEMIFFINKKKKCVFSCKLMETSIEVVRAATEVVRASIEIVKKNFHGFNSNFQVLVFFPLTSTNFHRFPATSEKSPCARMSYHELQALPLWWLDGPSFPSTVSAADLKSCTAVTRAFSVQLKRRPHGPTDAESS